MAMVARSASLCIVSTMTLLSTPSAFRRASTSRPLSPGMERSVTITSGRSRLAASMSSVAVAHRADDVEVVVLEQSGQALVDDRVVVGEQDGVSPHRPRRD